MMISPNRTEFAAPLNSQNVVSAEAERLLKQLVEQVKAAISLEEQPTVEDIDDRVLFESCIDGLQYQLVRCRSKSEQSVNLSPRELEIACLIAQGQPNKCIANTLSISPCTVSTHLRRIFIKLGVTSRAAMVARLMEESLL
jgi:two-component system, NarL family, nitrate/nitrite response regulator NarL